MIDLDWIDNPKKYWARGWILISNKQCETCFELSYEDLFGTKQKASLKKFFFADFLSPNTLEKAIFLLKIAVFKYHWNINVKAKKAVKQIVRCSSGGNITKYSCLEKNYIRPKFFDNVYALI